MNEAKTLLRSMEVLDIRQLIGEATEYDKKVALEVKKPKSWCKSVSAFANCMGGRLIWGISIDYIFSQQLKASSPIVFKFLENLIEVILLLQIH